MMADTTIRLWHVGPYRYSWEDAGSPKERFASYVFSLSAAPSGPAPAPVPPPPPPTEGYTQDWFSYNLPVLEQLLAPLVGQPVRALEVGVFEGRSSVWFLEHVLTHPDATLTWVDTFAGGSDHEGMDLTGLEQRFRANTTAFGAKLSGHVGKSRDVLRGMSGEQFDLIYIDASHEAPDVLADAVLAWSLLKPGGLLGFDDYGWRGPADPTRRPALAIDAFVSVMQQHLVEIHRGYQVWVRKIR